MKKNVHELKIYPKYFNAILNGSKPFEIRKNDRNFHVGDNVLLKEWDNNKYSGRTIYAEITYVLGDKFIGVTEGYVKNDRNFHVGDNVLLKEWDNNKYSGRTIYAEITYVLGDKFIGVTEGYVVLGIKVINLRDGENNPVMWLPEIQTVD